jgi:hypothetical protein
MVIEWLELSIPITSLDFVYGVCLLEVAIHWKAPTSYYFLFVVAMMSDMVSALLGFERLKKEDPAVKGSVKDMQRPCDVQFKMTEIILRAVTEDRMFGADVVPEVLETGCRCVLHHLMYLRHLQTMLDITLQQR